MHTLTRFGVGFDLILDEQAHNASLKLRKFAARRATGDPTNGLIAPGA